MEGANILTRSMITFGQGLNRAHPNLINIVNSIEGDDVKGFAEHTTGFLGHLATNVGRSLGRAVMRPRMKSRAQLSEYYEGQLSRLASNFAVSADLALILGGRLKFEEMLSGRFADSLGTLYLGYACLWYYNQNKNVEGIDEVFELAMESILKENQTALHGVQANFPIAGIGEIMGAVCFPTGKDVYKGPTDKMVQSLPSSSPPSASRTAIGGHFHRRQRRRPHPSAERRAAPGCGGDKVQSAARKAKRALTAEEQELVDRVAAMANEIVQVDVFDKLGKEKFEGDGYIRPALRNTRFEELENDLQERVSVAAKAKEHAAKKMAVASP